MASLVVNYTFQCNVTMLSCQVFFLTFLLFPLILLHKDFTSEMAKNIFFLDCKSPIAHTRDVVALAQKGGALSQRTENWQRRHASWDTGWSASVSADGRASCHQSRLAK
jgi:hypothetical protein